MAFDFFDTYFKYVGVTESPAIYHRWTALSIVGALIGRSVHFPFGHGQIYPNQYMLLTGSPGARKGTAIKIGTNLLSKIQYAHITPNRAAKEAFWGWMAEKDNVDLETLDKDGFDFDATWGGTTKEKETKVTEAYIAHDEFLDFIGSGDKDFVTNLTNLWDNLPKYTNPKTRGDNVFISAPTVNILSGITPSGIADSFTSMALGGGFFSRMLFIYSAPSGRKITFPSKPHVEYEESLIRHLREIEVLQGELVIESEVVEVIEAIYKGNPGTADSRFEFYHERRLTHVLKILIILAATRLSLTPTAQEAVMANTILYNAELSMSKALGEYGKSKYADVANKIINALNTHGPMTTRQLYKDGSIGRDLNKYGEIMEIMGSLKDQERIQVAKGSRIGGEETKYIPNNEVRRVWKDGLIDFNLLLDEEHTQ